MYNKKCTLYISTLASVKFLQGSLTERKNKMLKNNKLMHIGISWQEIHKIVIHRYT